MLRHDYSALVSPRAAGSGRNERLIGRRVESSAAILAAGSQASGLRGDGRRGRLPDSRPEAGATRQSRLVL